jgi:hypothetical protein
LDITIRYVTISHVGSGFQIGNGLSDNKGAAKDGGRYSIHDVVIEDINPDMFGGFGLFAQISMAPGESAAPTLHDVSIDHVTAFPPRVLFTFGGPFTDRKMTGLSITNSIFTAGTRTMGSTGGGPQANCSAQPQKRSPEDILHSCFSSYTFHHNVIIGGGSGWPKDNKTPGKIEDLGFSNHRDGNGGDYELQASSKFKGAGADRKDVGADIAAIKEATKGVE